MRNIQLQQIKIFCYNNNNYNEVMNEVNEFIIDVFNKHGNTCNVETNSKFIVVEYCKLCEVKR